MRPRALLVTLFMVAATAAAAQTPLTRTLVASGLERPVWVTHAPGDFSRLFVLEKRGRVRVIKDGVLLATPFLDIDALVGGGTSDFDERGLLGMAFHPDYQTNGFFFVFYTRNNNNTAVFRYSVSADPDVADPNSAQRVLAITQPQTNHNGGWIQFGPDGYLYIASGDGGGGGDDDSGHTPGVGNGQDATNLLGCMLRLDIDNDDFPSLPNTNYAIPADNPFADPNDPRAGEIWAYGLRNPWRNDFDNLTGDLWIADVGQSSWEEVDYQPSGLAGVNYGWRCREGAHNFNTTGDCSQTPFTDPIHEYAHSAGRCSITGGVVYRGCAIPDLEGAYFFGDYCTGEIWSLRYDGISVSDFTDHTAEIGLGSTALVSFGEDAYGEVYVCDQPNGRVYKITPNVPGGIVGEDCDGNGIDDACDIVAGAPDVNMNGVPDACECIGDVDGDGVTNISDLGSVLTNFGMTSATLADGDINGDTVVNITDLGLVLEDFGCSG